MFPFLKLTIQLGNDIELLQAPSELSHCLHQGLFSKTPPWILKLSKLRAICTPQIQAICFSIVEGLHTQGGSNQQHSLKEGTHKAYVSFCFNGMVSAFRELLPPQDASCKGYGGLNNVLCQHLCPFPPIFLHFPPFPPISPHFPPFPLIFPIITIFPCPTASRLVRLQLARWPKGVFQRTLW